MAVDTRNKRASCVSLDARRGRIGPNPDGSLANGADRQHMGLVYAGIAAQTPGVGGLGAGSRLMLLGAGCAAWMVVR